MDKKDLAQDKKTAAKAVHKHEKAMHPGKPMTKMKANERSNPYPGTKTSGIKIRGTGAATKGVMARGPMA